jgi:hypothetical protein
MPTDEAQLNELLGRFAIDPDTTGHVAPTDRSHPRPIGTWTIDPTHSSVSLAWRKLRLWTITGRRPCVSPAEFKAWMRTKQRANNATQPPAPGDLPGAACRTERAARLARRLARDAGSGNGGGGRAGRVGRPAHEPKGSVWADGLTTARRHRSIGLALSPGSPMTSGPGHSQPSPEVRLRPPPSPTPSMQCGRRGLSDAAVNGRRMTGRAAQR